MVDETDRRLLGILSESQKEMTLTEVMDALLNIYGETYRRTRIRNRLNSLVRYNYARSRDAEESIRGKPTRLYRIRRGDRWHVSTTRKR